MYEGSFNGCMCVCVCVLCAVLYAFAVCVRGRSTWHYAASSKSHSKWFSVCTCLYCVRVFVCVCTSLCVWVCLCVCYLCVCVYLYTWQKHDNGRVVLETSRLKREILFLTFTMWRIVICVIWPLFGKMHVNQKLLNRIGIFWYQFTPRKLLYHVISVNFVKFGPFGLSVFFGHPVYQYGVPSF